MKTEKVTLEFQQYEIEHILKALRCYSENVKNQWGSNCGYSLFWGNDTYNQKDKISNQCEFTIRSINRQMPVILGDSHFNFGKVQGKKCRIYGSEITFELFVSEKELKEKAFNIWDNPSNYWDVKNLSDEAYDKFLKLLWIDFPNGNTVRLADYANDNNII